jgi:hypothetical protein
VERTVVDRTTASAAFLLGAGVGAAGLLWRATRPVRSVSAGVLRGVLTAAAVAAPDSTAAFTSRGRSSWVQLQARGDQVLWTVVERVVEAVVLNVDLTELVCAYVDLDAVAAALDVDAVVARVDLDAVVRRVDVDAVAAALDVDKVVARVDLDAVVRRVDVDAVAAVLDVDRVVARVDLDAVVRRIDMVAIAREIIEALDLPELIRSSSGALASDTVRSVRSEAMTADDAVAGVVDRLLRRGGTAQAAPPGE